MGRKSEQTFRVVHRYMGFFLAGITIKITKLRLNKLHNSTANLPIKRKTPCFKEVSAYINAC
ncbi:MAG: hypothetical protein P8M03_03180 [Flavobacteriaceae bacterium]|nr:hypothetical protein [Flavobacteriaceae bacterium]